jgi:hypothetical protein
MNRFLSADSIVPEYGNPQNLNRYSYVNNNPLRYTDPTGHMMDQGDMGGGSGCSDPKYCRGGKLKSPEELKRIREQNLRKRNGNPPFATVTPVPTSTATPSYSTLPGQQCSSGNPCLNNFVPSATPSPTSNPYNVLATAGAELDITANTAVVGGIRYCTGNPEPSCGQTAEKAYPPLSPWGTVFDAGVGTKHIIDDASYRPPTQFEETASTVAFGISIPTSLIPLLIFFFAP